MYVFIAGATCSIATALDKPFTHQVAAALADPLSQIKAVLHEVTENRGVICHYTQVATACAEIAMCIVSEVQHNLHTRLYLC